MLGGIGTVALVLHLGMRWAVSGHAPWSNQFEFATAFAASVMIGNAIAERAYRDRRINLVVLPIALGLLVYAWSLPAYVKDPVSPLIPALQNNLLLTIHVSAAVTAYGVFAIAFAGAVIYLLQGGPRNRIGWLPEASVVESLANKAVMVGVPFQAAVLMLGAWWGSIAWSRPWGWDPKETAALTTFLIYVLYLHARNQRGWRGTPAAVILLIGFGATLFTFFGNYFLGGLHTYSGL
jgi:cytochrome c-type biogenesis protein CcsB